MQSRTGCNPGCKLSATGQHRALSAALRRRMAVLTRTVPAGGRAAAGSNPVSPIRYLLQNALFLEVGHIGSRRTPWAKLCKGASPEAPWYCVDRGMRWSHLVHLHQLRLVRSVGFGRVRPVDVWLTGVGVVGAVDLGDLVESTAVHRRGHQPVSDDPHHQRVLEPGPDRAHRVDMHYVADGGLGLFTPLASSAGSRRGDRSATGRAGGRTGVMCRGTGPVAMIPASGAVDADSIMRQETNPEAYGIDCGASRTLKRSKRRHAPPADSMR